MPWRRRRAWPRRCASISRRTSATATPAPRTTRPTPRSPGSARTASTSAIRPVMPSMAKRPRGSARSCASSPTWACPASSSCIATCSSSRARWRSRSAGPTRCARCCRRAAGAARRCRRSSATSRGSRTSTRSRTSCCSGASSTRRSPRCPTSTSTSRATSARSSSRASTRGSVASARPSSPRSPPTARAPRFVSSARRSACRRARSSGSRGDTGGPGKPPGLPAGEFARAAGGSGGWSGPAVDRDIVVALGEGRERPGRWRWLVGLSREAHGLPRHLSQHSGGMIVATRPLVDCCAVVPAAMEGRQMVMWDKDSCSDAGFLKIDLLGLGMLSAVERCVEHIAARRGERIDLSRIPYDDPATFECIRNADTTGVFQIESRAQMGSLHRTRPENLDDLTIQVAIVRPGPIQGGAVNPYIERRQALRKDPTFEVRYDHPSLEPVLCDTLGTIIFQDQVIEVAMAFAGFSPGEAEGLRRAMSRKRSVAAIEAYHERFVEGAMTRHGDVDAPLAERVWTMIVGFSGFGFPKAHGAAFGLLAYQSTWLRVHYGPEFLCALLDEQPMGFYPPDALVH